MNNNNKYSIQCCEESKVIIGPSNNWVSLFTKADNTYEEACQRLLMHLMKMLRDKEPNKYYYRIIEIQTTVVVLLDTTEDPSFNLGMDRDEDE